MHNVVTDGGIDVAGEAGGQRLRWRRSQGDFARGPRRRIDGHPRFQRSVCVVEMLPRHRRRSCKLMADLFKRKRQEDASGCDGATGSGSNTRSDPTERSAHVDAIIPGLVRVRQPSVPAAGRADDEADAVLRLAPLHRFQSIQLRENHAGQTGHG